MVTGRLRIAIHGGVATLAAASALGSVFDGYGWLFPVLGGIAVVVAISELVRSSPLPAALGPLLAAGAVTCYITAAYAGSTAYGHVIPSGDSFHTLAAIARQGFHDVHKLSTPVPTHQGLVLLAVVGIAAVALVVDLLAVTMRRAAVAGLPLLATFALCTSVAKHGAGWVPFVLGTAGYLWLLLADSHDRLSRWGRPLGVPGEARPRFNWSDTEVMPSPLSVMGRRIGLSAIAVGVLVPLLIPGLRGGIPRGGNGFGLGGHGSSERFTVNPIVTIRGNLTSTQSRPLLTVRTTDPDPGYLRMTALDQFDGTSFAPSTLQAPPEAQVSRGISAPIVNGPVRVVQVAVHSLDVPWLPLPTQVDSVSVPGDWRYDAASNTVFSARVSTDGLTYTAQFIHPHPTAAALEQSIAPDPAMRPYLDLPGSISQSVRDLTARVTADARTPFDKAVAIQRFLTSPPFQYDLNVPADDSSNALADFLLKTHKGFCQQYASAMAVMARIAGIPSRVAVGFTRGEAGPDHTYVVSTHDAHAWPELDFSGFGWVPFEPTPRADGQAQIPSYTVEAANGGPNGPGANGGANNGGTNTPGRSKIPDKHGLLDQSVDERGVGPTASAPSPNHTRRDATLALLGVLVLGLLVPSCVRVVQRRRRWRQATTPAEVAAAAWAELRATAIDAKAGWTDGLTPRATARVLRAESAGLDAADVAALDRIVNAVQRAWYAPTGAQVKTDTLEDDVDDLRSSLFADATIGERVILRMWPRSVLSQTRELVGRLVSLLDALDVAGARLRARLRPRHA